MGVGRIHRLLRLIMLLQSGRARSVNVLTAELGVSRRTLFRDLKMLELAGIPYFYNRGVGYRIARSFFLPPVSFTVTETLGLMLLGKTAAARARQPLMGPALSAISKLSTTVPEPMRSACTELMEHVSIDPGPVPYDEANGESGHYALLSRSIDEGRVCRMTYQGPLDAEPFECELHPYLLHYSTRSWYVLGWVDRFGQTRTFKVGRIRHLRETTRRFERKRDFKAEKHLGRAWRLIPEGRVEQVELDFSQKVANNVADVRWHASQAHQFLPDGRLRVRFEFDGLKEIAWWICGYADQVVVRKPKALRKRVRDMLDSAVMQYKTK